MLIIGQVSEKKVYEQQYKLAFNQGQHFYPKYFIERMSIVWVMLPQEGGVFSQLHYGMVPFWSHKPVIHFESPVEGSVNPGAERLKKRIFLHPSYRRPVRENRCIIPVDYVIIPNDEGNPFLIFSDTNKTIALAGIYDSWQEERYHKGSYRGFSILTNPSGDAFRQEGITRIPLVLSGNVLKRWLDPGTPLAEIARFMEITGKNKLNGYPVSRSLYREKHNGIEICKPRGNMILETSQLTGETASFLQTNTVRQGNL